MPASAIPATRWSAEVSALFLPPETEPSIPGTASTLHLLRREIIETLINLEPPARSMVSEQRAAEIANNPKAIHRLFASTSLICTGIDLLATLSYGDHGSIGPRFMYLLRKSRPERFDALRARRVWALRNGLAHSFGLRAHYSGAPSKKRRPVRTLAAHPRVRARLTDVRIALVSEPLRGDILRTGARQWLVSVPDLYNVFREIVSERAHWFAQLSASDRQRARIMMRRYGRIQIGLQPPRRRVP